MSDTRDYVQKLSLIMHLGNWRPTVDGDATDRKKEKRKKKPVNADIIRAGIS